MAEEMEPPTREGTLRMQSQRIALLFLLALVCSLVLLPVRAADWPQHLGPSRNGISQETGLLKSWPAGGPKEVWRMKGGVGMSAVVVAGGQLMTLVQKEGKQWLIALDAKTGKPIWQTPLAPS